MRLRTLSIIALVAASANAAPSLANSKIIERFKTEVDGQSFRVLRYENGSVQVIQGGIFGNGVSFDLRDRMRRAVSATTHCAIADDYWLDGKLFGKLDCSFQPQKAGA